MTAALGALGVQAQASPAYGVFQGREFMQVGDFVFTTMPSRPAYWECWAHGLPADGITEATVTTPTGSTVEMQVDASAGSAVGGEDFMNASQRAAEFPDGIYAMAFIRADGSSYRVDCLQATAPAPEHPRFLGLPREDLKAGTDLQLTWEPSPGLGPDDFQILTVRAFNFAAASGWMYLTPWFGQPGALSGLSTSVTVPGSLLKPGDFMTVTLTVYRVVQRETAADGVALAGSATGISTTMNVPDEPHDSDVVRYRVAHTRIFQQEGASAPVSVSERGFEFVASAWGRDSGRLTNVTLLLPTGSQPGFVASPGSLLWEARSSHATEAELLAAAPPGSYPWWFEGTAQGSQTAPMTVALGTWPGPVSVANWDAIQTNSFTNDVVLRWTPPAGITTSAQIEFSVADADGSIVYRRPSDEGDDAIIPAIAGELTIPADSLQDGDDYEGRLLLVEVRSEDTLSLEGATGTVVQGAETRFPLGSRVAPPIEIPSPVLPLAAIDEDYLGQIEGFGGRGDLTWTIVNGALPKGLGLAASGLISGIPCASGVFTFTVRATDMLGNFAERVVVMETTGILQPLTISTTAFPVVGDGVFSLFPVIHTGGVRPFHWSVVEGRLPTGLSLHAASGLIHGIAEEAGDFPFTVELEDGAGQTQRQALRLQVPSVVENPRLRITGLQVVAGRGLRLGLSTVPDELVTVEFSTDLRTWQPLITGNLPADQSLEWAPPATAGPVFYRALRGRPEPEYQPVSIQPVLDATATVGALLTSSGTSLALSDSRGIEYRLDVPTNAVLEAVTIRMSLLEAAAGLPSDIGFLAGVTLAPEGLRLLRAATLTIRFPGPLSENAMGFAFDENGADFHLYPGEVAGNVITFPIAHLSGAMAGTGPGTGMSTAALERAGSGGTMSLKAACNSQSTAESWIAMLVRSDLGGREMLWPTFYDWFDGTISPHLKAAAGNDELLWFASDEFCAFVNLLDRYILQDPTNNDGISQHAVTLRNKGWRLLAKAYANAVNRSHSRCVTEYRAFQAIRMMKIARAARALGLGQHLSQPDFFSEGRMLDRFQRAFRFEVEIFSRVDIKPTGGGRFTARVLSKKCPIETQEYPEDGDEFVLANGTPKDLTSEYWRLKSEGDRITAVVTTGQLIPVRLTLRPNYPVEDRPERCSQGTTWNDPTEPDIILILDAKDPVQKMTVHTKYGPRTLPVGSSNWHEVFKLFHALQLVNEVDANGAVHMYSVELEGEEDWKYLAKEEFAKARFSGPPKYAEEVGDQATEETTVLLHHAPKALTGADTTVP